MSLSWRKMKGITGQNRKRWIYSLAGTCSATLTMQPRYSTMASAFCCVPDLRRKNWKTPINAPQSVRSGFFSDAPFLNAQATDREVEMANDAVQILEGAIDAVNPYTAVKSHFEMKDASSLRIGENQLSMDDYDEVVLVAFGKASSAMASAILEQLQLDDNTLRIPKCSGVVICKDDHVTSEENELLSKFNIHIQEASHPVPDSRSAEGAKLLMDLVEKKAAPKTLVVCCISGGGSALFCEPRQPLSLEDLQSVNSVLLASGMGIHDMNIIRKRLEEGKGGRLAARCFPSQLVTLVLSDVLGDPLDLIASGPTVPDTSTWEDAWTIVKNFELEDKLPQPVLEILEQGMKGTVPDSPASDHPIFESSQTVLVGNNALAVAAAADKAKKLGYNPVVLGTQIEGEAKEIANFYISMAQYLQEPTCAFAAADSLPTALIAGGETTVSLTPDSGKGGRNQELALSASLRLDSLELRNVVLASVGTDGTDGPTDAAGAVVYPTAIDGRLEKAQRALAKHDAYSFFDEIESSQEDLPTPLIKTGPTGTNVADVCVTLIDRPTVSSGH